MRAGRKLDLTPKEFALLSLLARRGGEVLSRTAIAEFSTSLSPSLFLHSTVLRN